MRRIIVPNPKSPLQSHRSPVHIGSVTLRSRNMAALAAFYENSIGLVRIAEAADKIIMGSGGVGYLHLLAAPDARQEPHGGAGLFHTAFLLPSRGELGVWFQAAHGRDVRFDGASDHGVSDAFYLTDPEGNGIEVYADRPPSAWARPAGGKPHEVLMTTLAMDIKGVVAEGAKRAPRATFPDAAAIGHVHLKVGDIAPAQTFYGETLGLERTYGRPGAAFFAAGGYHHHIATNTWSSAGAGRRDPSNAGLAAVEFVVDSGHVMATLGGKLDDPWGNRLVFTASAT
jgi:catechol 2,3-dioxygenase